MILTVVRMLTAFGFDILAGAGATKSAFWVNLGWSFALIPALLVGTHRGGIHGAALAHAIVGLGVALPLTSIALHPSVSVWRPSPSGSSVRSGPGR